MIVPYNQDYTQVLYNEKQLMKLFGPYIERDEVAYHIESIAFIINRYLRTHVKNKQDFRYICSESNEYGFKHTTPIDNLIDLIVQKS